MSKFEVLIRWLEVPVDIPTEVRREIVTKLSAAEELAETVDDAVNGDNYTPELAGALHAYRKAGETK